MKASRIILGLFLVAIGIGLLLQSLGIIDFEWGSIWRLWPLIFIVWGLSAIFNTSGGFWISLIGLIIIVAIILFSLFDNGWHSISWGSNIKHQDIALEYSSEVQSAKLVVNDGAGNYTLFSDTAKLAELTADTSTGGYSFTENRQGSNAIVTVERNNTHWNFGRVYNDLVLRLNPNPVWDMEWNIGAVHADLNLERFKIGSVVVKAGATDMRLRFGSLSDVSNLNIKSGASNIKITAPQIVGVKINDNSGLTGTSFKGLAKRDDGNWYSSNYDSTTKKLNINLETGVSSITVEQY